MAADDDRGGVTELAVWRRWMQVPEDVRPRILSSAFCPRCWIASFASGWIVRKVAFDILIESTCAGCDGPIVPHGRGRVRVLVTMEESRQMAF